MDAVQCIEGRFSVRKFRPEPVPTDMLQSIIVTAQRSPSYKNTQPWEVAIVSGAAKEALSSRLAHALENGIEPSPDIAAPTSWPATNQARIDDLYRKRNIPTNDPELAKRGKIANFRFYGAPHGIFLYQDAELGQWSIFDMGLFAQSLMLAAYAHGVGTVPQAFLTDYASIVKETLGIPAAKRLCLGISIGYPDVEHPINQGRTERVPTAEMLRWIQ